MKANNMNDKIALVTGGTRGIGSAISRGLLEEGIFVVVVAVNEERNKKWIETQKQSSFDKVDSYVCDVADYDKCQTVVADIKKKYGKIDILINNAGVTRDAFFNQMGKNNWDTVMKINLNSLFNVTRPIVEIMLENGYGRIVNIASVNGQKGQFGQTNYATAKAGMHGFTKSLAREMASNNITVNTVSPGYVATEMVMKLPENIRQNIIAQIPVGRLGTPKEIADLVVFLTRNNSGYITGADFSINGGLHMF
jgi:acetoacetyl-CoA reductase